MSHMDPQSAKFFSRSLHRRIDPPPKRKRRKKPSWQKWCERWPWWIWLFTGLMLGKFLSNVMEWMR